MVVLNGTPKELKRGLVECWEGYYPARCLHGR